MHTPPRILVLEDDALIAMSISESLVDAGYETTIASSLEEAEAAISGAGVDAATLDFHIGRTDSEAFVGMLEQRGVPFLFCTGSMETEVREHFATDAIVLGKPFLDSDLVSAIASLLQRDAATRPAFAQASSTPQSGQ
jgi:DNA-binding response OmpR family regulator